LEIKKPRHLFTSATRLSLKLLDYFAKTILRTIQQKH